MENCYIDLHLHLDGAITAQIARELIRLQQMDICYNDDELNNLLKVSADCRSLNDFLKCFDFPLSLLQTKEALSEAVFLVSENIRKQGVIYAEIRFAPQLHTLKGMNQEDAILAALNGLKRSNIKINLILCCMRGDNNDNENITTVKLARKYLVEDGGVTAIDLAGAEGLFPTLRYENLFKTANEYGIPFTIHAGEADGPESIKAAIEFGAKRIGHGVRLLEDAVLMDTVKQNHIYLEMCPTSNLMTCAIDDIFSHPLKKYFDYGIPVTLNTDDMAIEDITLESEFDMVMDVFNLTPEDRLVLLNNAVDAAFTNNTTKDEIRCMIRNCYKN